MTRRKRSSRTYSLPKSPFFRLERKRDLAALLGISLREMSKLVELRELNYIFRTETIGGKVRALAIPIRNLRRCHERVLRLLRRIELPEHIRCPKKGSSPIQNALTHAGQGAITTADIKDFYPSTTEDHVFRFFRFKAQMSEDCARILARLCTIQDRLPIGSPVSPHLACLVHLDLFDDAAELSASSGNQLSVWVDDVSFSGVTRRRDILASIRHRAARKGFKLHKLQKGGSKRSVEITGTLIRRGRGDVANASNLKLKSLLDAFAADTDPVGKLGLGNKILGVLRYHQQLKRAAGRRTEREEAKVRWLKREIEQITANLNRTSFTPDTVESVSHGEDAPF